MKSFEKVNFKGVFRAYQQRVLDNADAYLADGRINVVAAPGSGKTILGLELIKRLNAPTIILSPTTTIKDQWGKRFADSFLDGGEDAADYFSYDLHEITLLNSITYQALHSIMNRLPVEEDGVVIDYSDLDVFAVIKEHGVKTICLDEAHHLQNEWQKALEKFVSTLGSDVRIIALTATPPYDANTTEWARYESVCGPIDEEIFVPELVKDKTICPHQDYIYFNYPTKEEAEAFADYKRRVLEAIRELRALPIYDGLYRTICEQYAQDKERVFDRANDYVPLLAIIATLGITVDLKIIKSLTGGKTLPAPTIESYETTYRFLLGADMLADDQKDAIEKTVKKYSLWEKGPVFTLKEADKRKLISSVGKLNSIVKIAQTEHDNLGPALRMLVLTDYIKKESIAALTEGKLPSDISVVSIFGALFQSNPQYRIGALSGNLILLPDDCQPHIGVSCKIIKIGQTGFSEYVFPSANNRDKVEIVSRLFQQGHINMIVGTKALLGEGWDAPCINTLILASVVGSYMLSNQMRGRAIRIDRNDPDKVSNIWHLVTLEPEYIFEERLLESIRIKQKMDYSKMSSYDYDVLVRRFNCFVGPNYDTGEIESGIDRVSILKPPYNKHNVEAINEQMLALARTRDDTRTKWDGALEHNFRQVEEVQIPAEKALPPFVYTNVSGIILSIGGMGAALGALGVGIRGMVSSAGHDGLSLAVVVIAAVAVSVFLPLFSKFLAVVVAHNSPKKNMLHMAKALLWALQDLGYITHRANVRECGNDLFIGIALADASVHEQNVFNQALTELLTPIDNPRYVLIMRTHGSRDYGHSFACPAALGQKKEAVEHFAANLAKNAGTFEAVFTRNDEGRAVMLRCQKRSFISKNDRELKRRSMLLELSGK